MKVTLKDGSFKEYAQPMAVIDIAKDISEGLARMACVAEIDGEVKDLRTIVDKDCTLNIFTAKDPEGLAALRHTASHVMAQAIKRIWPETKLAIGPSKSCIKATKDALSGSNNIGDYLHFKSAKHASTGSYSSYKIVGGNCFYKK